jgi:ribosome maturation factor RimP
MTVSIADVPARVRDLVSAHRADVEVVDVIVSADVVRVLVDHPDGVSHALCEDVARELLPIRERYALEVSSPGLNRPLVAPHHYERAVGSDVEVRLRGLVDGRRKLAGRLTSFGDDQLAVELDSGGTAVVPLADVARANIRWKPVGT